MEEVQNDILNAEQIAKPHRGAKPFTFEDFASVVESVAQSYGEKELKDTKQGTWKAILTEAGQILGLNKETIRLEEGFALNQNGLPYDSELLGVLADFFVRLSHRYNKYPTPYAFALWVGMPTETIDEYVGASKQNLSGVNGAPLKKIVNARAESITDRLFDSGNVTGQIMLANNVLGWDTSRSSQTIEHRSEPTTLEADFSSLGLESGQNVVQIDENPTE